MDLIKTIDENAEVEDFSEDSDAEVEVNKLQCITIKQSDCFRAWINDGNLIFTNHTFLVVFSFIVYFSILVSTNKGASQEEGGI